MSASVRFRALPNGLALSELGLGTSSFGNLYGRVSDEDCRAAFDVAWAGGVRYFDTAPHYGLGLAEKRLGLALRDRPRDDLVVSTKVGRLLVPSPPGGPELDDAEGFMVPATSVRSWDFSREGILRSIDASLDRLGLDDVDIIYLHDPDNHWDAASTTGIATLLELRDQGVTRAIGAAMNQSGMLTEFVRRFDIDVVMVAGRYTLLDRSAEDDLLRIAEERAVAVVAAGIYNSGLLAQDVVSQDASFDYRAASPETVARARRIADTCRRQGVTLPDVAVQFPLRKAIVASAVAGSRDASESEALLDRYHALIPDELWGELDRTCP